MPLKNSVLEASKMVSTKTLLLSKQGSTPTPWARGLRDQIQKWALRTQKNPLFLGFSVLRRGLRPWSRKGPGHGVGVDPETVNY